MRHLLDSPASIILVPCAIAAVLLAGWGVTVLFQCARAFARGWRHARHVLAQADAEMARPVTRDDVVISPEWERLADDIITARRAQTATAELCGFCGDLTAMGDPEACACPLPCGRAWCTALRRQRAARRGQA